jgi:hypothetical protein
LAKMMQVKVRVQISWPHLAFEMQGKGKMWTWSFSSSIYISPTYLHQCKLQDDNSSSTRNHEPTNVGVFCYCTLLVDATFIFAMWHNYWFSILAISKVFSKH